MKVYILQATHRLDINTDIMAVHEDSAVGSEQIASDQTQRRRFAGAIDAEQPEALTGRHAERDAVNGHLVAVVTSQVVHHDNFFLRTVDLHGG